MFLNQAETNKYYSIMIFVESQEICTDNIRCRKLFIYTVQIVPPDVNFLDTENLPDHTTRLPWTLPKLTPTKIMGIICIWNAL